MIGVLTARLDKKEEGQNNFCDFRLTGFSFASNKTARKPGKIGLIFQRFSELYRLLIAFFVIEMEFAHLINILNRG
jgi:hypothetical protein